MKKEEERRRNHREKIMVCPIPYGDHNNVSTGRKSSKQRCTNRCHKYKTVDCGNEKGLITKYECPHLGRRSLYFVDTKQQHVSVKRLRYVVLLTQMYYIIGWVGKQGYGAMCVKKLPRTLFSVPTADLVFTILK